MFTDFCDMFTDFSGTSCGTRIAYLTSLLEVTLQDSVQQVRKTLFPLTVSTGINAVYDGISISRECICQMSQDLSSLNADCFSQMNMFRKIISRP